MVKLLLIVAAALGLLATSAVAAPNKRIVGNKRYTPINDNSTVKAPISGIIQYNGGPLLIGQVNVYYIYYGTWNLPDERDILENLVEYISSTTYFNIEMTYYQALDGIKQYVTGPVVFQQSIDDDYSAGYYLSDQDVVDVVTNHLLSNDLPIDTNGVYYLLTSPDVTETSGFCEQYCGYHNSFDLDPDTNIKYSFVGDVSNCLAGCAPENQEVSPNNNPGVDGMASIITHELMEAISDPDPGLGWTDASGNENADKCAYVYGEEQTLPNGAKYNVLIGNYNYLIQENWNARVQACQLGTGHSSVGLRHNRKPQYPFRNRNRKGQL